MQTNITLSENLEKEVNNQVKEGKFKNKSDFFKSAIETYLSLQKGDLTWDILAAPFRKYAKEKGIKESDLLEAVERGRGKISKSSK